MGQAGTVRTMGEMPMLSKDMKDSIFVKNAQVITFLGWECSGCFPLATGLSKVALVSVNNSFLINIIGVADLYTVIEFIVWANLVFLLH